VRSREELARAVVTVLAQVRREAGVTRQQLSARSGVSSHTIAKIEQVVVTDPGFTVVATLADALDLPLERLLRLARDTLETRRDPASHVGASEAPESTP
jgi:transcriptional regulator with XRE-family HTH domain